MDLKKRIKIAFVLNLLIFVVMFFGAICSIFDFNFMTTGTHRFSPDFSRFKYFTLDSNILAGIISSQYCRHCRIISPPELAAKVQENLTKGLGLYKA